jgi:hypothetical protein
MSSDLSFLSACGDRLSVRQEEQSIQFSQLLRLQLKVGDPLKRFIKPDPKKLFPMLKPVFKKVKKTDHAPINAQELGLVLEKHRDRRHQNQSQYQTPYYQPGVRTPWYSGWLEDIEFALLVTYQQTWEPLGYSRGELLNSLCLAPGEETSIDVFTWDRKKISQERDQASELESTSSASLTGRSSLETVLNSNFKLTTGAEVGGEAKLDLAMLDVPATVGADASVNLNMEMSEATQDTRKQVLEATRNATNAMRSSRKTRITESSEFGTENRTTRKISNTNRCHTLNFDYFEIIEHYDVTLQLKHLEQVAMLPIQKPSSITKAWLLCNEATLRKCLPDAIYLKGFEAARLLLAADKYRSNLPSVPVSVNRSRNQAPSGRGSLNPQKQQYRDILKPRVDEIVAIAKVLRAADTDRLERAMARLLDINLMDSPSEREWEEAIKEAGHWVYTKTMLTLVSDFFEKTERLKAACNSSSETCYQPLQTYWMYMQRWLINDAIHYGLLFGIAIQPFDCGLEAAINSAWLGLLEVDQLRVTQQGAAAAVNSGSEDLGTPAEATPPKTPEQKMDEVFGLRILTEAEVELDRLVCHVKSRLDTYVGAIFAEQGRCGWMELLQQYPHVLEKVEPRLLSVQQGFAVFPLRNKYQRNLQENNQALIQSLTDDPGSKERVVLPTQGIVLESRLGQCDACETFVQDHRTYDLAQKSAEVKEQEAKAALTAIEAARHQARLDSDPRLLDDPVTPDAGLTVKLKNLDVTGD